MWLSRLKAWLLLVSFHHWADAQDQNSFSDATSKQVWTLAYWTTSATPQVCVPKYNPGWQVLSVITTTGAPIYGQALAVISVSETQKMVHVHFRGPDAITTFIFSGYTYLLKSVYETVQIEGYDVVQEHGQTYQALMQAGLRKALNDAWDEYCDFPILISGHSVGGCPAQMLALKLKNSGMWDYSKISLYIYSAPRCGYQAFAYAVNKAAQTRYQIRLPDYAIQLPAVTCTTDNPASPQQCFWHAGYAVQYAKNFLFGTYSGPTRCATAETAACLTGSILNIGNQNGFYSLTYGFSPPVC